MTPGEVMRDLLLSPEPFVDWPTTPTVAEPWPGADLFWPVGTELQNLIVHLWDL